MIGAHLLRSLRLSLDGLAARGISVEVRAARPGDESAA